MMSALLDVGFALSLFGHAALSVVLADSISLFTGTLAYMLLIPLVPRALGLAMLAPFILVGLAALAVVFLALVTYDPFPE